MPFLQPVIRKLVKKDLKKNAQVIAATAASNIIGSMSPLAAAQRNKSFSVSADNSNRSSSGKSNSNSNSTPQLPSLITELSLLQHNRSTSHKNMHQSTKIEPLTENSKVFATEIAAAEIKYTNSNCDIHSSSQSNSRDNNHQNNNNQSKSSNHNSSCNTLNLVEKQRFKNENNYRSKKSNDFSNVSYSSNSYSNALLPQTHQGNNNSGNSNISDNYFRNHQHSNRRSSRIREDSNWSSNNSNTDFNYDNDNCSGSNHNHTSSHAPRQQLSPNVLPRQPLQRILGPLNHSQPIYMEQQQQKLQQRDNSSIQPNSASQPQSMQMTTLLHQHIIQQQQYKQQQLHSVQDLLSTNPAINTNNIISQKYISNNSSSYNYSGGDRSSLSPSQEILKTGVAKRNSLPSHGRYLMKINTNNISSCNNSTDAADNLDHNHSIGSGSNIKNERRRIGPDDVFELLQKVKVQQNATPLAAEKHIQTPQQSSDSDTPLKQHLLPRSKTYMHNSNKQNSSNNNSSLSSNNNSSLSSNNFTATIKNSDSNSSSDKNMNRLLNSEVHLQRQLPPILFLNTQYSFTESSQL